MDDRQRQAFVDMARRMSEENTKDRASARAALIRDGIYREDGKMAREYRTGGLREFREVRHKKATEAA